MKKTLTSYDILNIHQGASQIEIDKAYRYLAKSWHPDLHNNNGKRDIATRNFKLLQEAYANIKTSQLRSTYNNQLAIQKRAILINQNKIMNDNHPIRSFFKALDSAFRSNDRSTGA